MREIMRKICNLERSIEICNAKIEKTRSPEEIALTTLLKKRAEFEIDYLNEEFVLHNRRYQEMDETTDFTDYTNSSDSSDFHRRIIGNLMFESNNTILFGRFK